MAIKQLKMLSLLRHDHGVVQLRQEKELLSVANALAFDGEQQRRRAAMTLALKLDWVLSTLAFLLITGIVVGVI
jgi:hypothetical protein